jgi:hypothetical protein
VLQVERVATEAEVAVRTDSDYTSLGHAVESVDVHIWTEHWTIDQRGMRIQQHVDTRPSQQRMQTDPPAIGGHSHVRQPLPCARPRAGSVVFGDGAMRIAET